MKMMDCVEVIVEKQQYIREGVHQGMQGWICLDDNSSGTWLVNFPQCGEKNDIAEIPVKEEDLKLIPVMDATVNEQIKEQFENAEKTGDNSTAIFKENEDISDYMV